jgi:CRISPR/Cas system-associated protein Cas10 (large subunit of type III CRISPR-Cas system)
MSIASETEVEQDLEKLVNQKVHADIYDVSEEKLEQLQKEEPDEGGDLCTICERPGCRIGPMGRG